MRFNTIAAIVVCAVNATVVAGASSKAKEKSAMATPVTVSGCLERDDAAYRLRETNGAQAPKEPPGSKRPIKRCPIGARVLRKCARNCYANGSI